MSYLTLIAQVGFLFCLRYCIGLGFLDGSQNHGRSWKISKLRRCVIPPLGCNDMHVIAAGLRKLACFFEGSLRCPPAMNQLSLPAICSDGEAHVIFLRCFSSLRPGPERLLPAFHLSRDKRISGLNGDPLGRLSLFPKAFEPLLIRLNVGGHSAFQPLHALTAYWSQASAGAHTWKSC
jgi:hypothetical protein